jgi:hypothetical protein
MVTNEEQKELKHIILPDQSIDLLALNVVQLEDSILNLHTFLRIDNTAKQMRDLALVGKGVHNENQGVVILNLLHGRLGGQRVLDYPPPVHRVHAGQ